MSAAAIASVALAAAGCGGIVDRVSEEAAERVTEEVVERAVEADSGGEVEIDFDGGEIRVESEDGDITFSADEDGVSIDGSDADGNDFSLDADENGLDVEGADGSSLDIDDDGTFVATDENGETVTGEADGDGGFRVEDSDGESVFQTGEEIPEQWPDDIPEPEGLSEVLGSYFSDGGAANVTVTGTLDGSPGDTLADYGSRLEDAGFEETSTFSQGEELASATYGRGETLVTVSAQVGDSGTVLVVTIA